MDSSPPPGGALVTYFHWFSHGFSAEFANFHWSSNVSHWLLLIAIRLAPTFIDFSSESHLVGVTREPSPPILLQHHDITILQYCDSQCWNIENLQQYNITISQHCNITILKYCNNAILRYYNTAIVQYCSITKLRYCNITMLHFTTLHFYNITGTILRHCNITASQNQDIKIIWYYNTIITIFHSFNISILQLCNITMIIIDFSRHLPRPSSNPPSLKASCGLGGMREA